MEIGWQTVVKHCCWLIVPESGVCIQWYTCFVVLLEHCSFYCEARVQAYSCSIDAYLCDKFVFGWPDALLSIRCL